MLWLLCGVGLAAEIKVAPGDSVADAIGQAQPGDTVVLGEGEHQGPLETARAGEDGAPITIRGEDDALLSASGTVIDIEHDWIVVEDLVIVGGYGDGPAVRVGDGVRAPLLRGLEIRESGRDCLDVGAAIDVQVEDTLLHHCLRREDGAADASGVKAGAVQGMSLRDIEIYAVSGDAILLGGGDAAEAWSDVRIDGCALRREVLDEDANGFAEGERPGDDGLETRAVSADEPASLEIHDLVVSGFSDEAASALLLKDNVDVVIDGLTVTDCRVGVDAWGPGDGRDDGATVRVRNGVIQDVDVAFHRVGDVPLFAVYNTTLGLDVGAVVQDEGEPSGAMDLQNLLVLTETLADGLEGAGNLAVDTIDFVDAAGGDYHLLETSEAIDAGVDIAEVDQDRDGAGRPVGDGWDVGAYEFGGVVDDTGDTGVSEDTGPQPERTSAALMAGEVGGCGCSSAGVRGVAWLAWVLSGLLVLRRKR